MTYAPDRVLLIDTDNGLGSPSGDIDDGFALAALIRSGLPIAAITTVAGNTTAELSYRNTTRLAAILDYSGPVLRAADAAAVIGTFTGRIAALGPLTSVVAASGASEIVIVGGTFETHGRWPPLWPYEFNLTFDRNGARRVFHADVPLTIFPIDIARRMWAREPDLDDIPGPFGEMARKESRRWFRHLFWLRQTRRFPIYDLAAAMYLIATEPSPGGRGRAEGGIGGEGSGLTMVDTVASMRESTFIEFGKGSRPVRVCTAVRRELLWQRFLQLFA
ncbi:MAG TPA: nucleoside hydrolase [Thermoanaerobaculia bacterium]|nr:nucleoside hydrolase [Thermoanaerobaculia bacterium]